MAYCIRMIISPHRVTDILPSNNCLLKRVIKSKTDLEPKIILLLWKIKSGLGGILVDY